MRHSTGYLPLTVPSTSNTTTVAILQGASSGKAIETEPSADFASSFVPQAKHFAPTTLFFNGTLNLPSAGQSNTCK